MLWERPDRGAGLGSLEPDLSRCLVCGCGRPISPAFAPRLRYLVLLYLGACMNYQYGIRLRFIILVVESHGTIHDNRRHRSESVWRRAGHLGI